MAGRGVTNYSTSKPSCAYSTSTTEFDDALLSRGIITFEQAMLAKGASPDEALRLTALNNNDKHKNNNNSNNNNNNCAEAGTFHRKNGDIDDEQPSEDDDDSRKDDEQFLESYRKMRLSQFLENKERPKLFGQVIPINRTDWNREVNDASEDGTWVVIHLTAQNSSPASHPLHLDICYLMENDIIPQLAHKFTHVKFVSIPSTSAIPNWPEENLPTIFCYRYGILQHQLLGLKDVGGACINIGRVEWRLAQLGVLHTQLDRDPQPEPTLSNISTLNETINIKNGMSRFGGGMATLATQRDDDESDYDDVD